MACSYVKDPAFAEEKEWRLVAPVYPKTDAEAVALQFRDGPLGVTPFVSLNLRGEDGLVPVAEIVVGPGHNPDLRVQAIRMLLEGQGFEYGRVQVRVSDVPFRP